ncbi:MAG: nucleotidyltransferase family protein [Chloroflexi bacterium]|nr:nucleotidyltransferase family protein [Chloroflexota bacterium]
MRKKKTTSRIDEIKKKALPILRRHDVLQAAVFGSVARGEATQKSDLDLLVTLPENKSLLDLVRLEFDLQEALGRKVDVLTYRALHRRIRDQVLREQVAIL